MKKRLTKDKNKFEMDTIVILALINAITMIIIALIDKIGE